MSKISDEYLKIMKDIETHISNEEEKDYIKKKIAELSSLYLELIDRVTDISEKRIDDLEEEQDELNKKISKMSETLNLIKKDIYEDEDYDFEIVCPYCNHEFVASVEDELKEEIECPECHNIIELDWDDDEEDDCCSGHCHSCGSHCHGEMDEEEILDDEDVEDENNAESQDNSDNEDDM